MITIRNILNVIAIVFSIFIISACKENNTKDKNKNNTETKQPDIVIEDVHSLSNFNEIKLEHLDLDLKINFEKKEIQGIAKWTINNIENKDTLILDTDELRIDSIKLDDIQLANYDLLPSIEHIGSALRIKLIPNTQTVTIYYGTQYNESDTFAALQWLEPSQTFGKKKPFLFTQAEPTMSRCWIPCQDAPAVKVTYSAKVQVPNDLLALMSASNPQQKNDSGLYHFEMNQPISMYLMALAVGDLAFSSIDERTGVYAEPIMLEKSKKEFSEMPQMLSVAEGLIGKYDWERYDVLVLPSGFPIGGMENPRLTFLSPTIIVGDQSLVSLIAHELAHSWAGNLVTNANWNDLWINEGFTVYLERRIMEAIRGKDYADMLWSIGKQDLDYTINKLGVKSDLTKLKLNLKGLNALESFTDIAYEKGGFFLWSIEQVVGRDTFDLFLRNFYAQHKFSSISTEYFINYLEENLISKNSNWKKKINYIDWIFNPGIPSNCPNPGNIKFSEVDSIRYHFEKNKNLSDLTTNDWSTHEWLHFIRNISDSIGKDELLKIDSKYNLMYSNNSEIACAWYTLGISRNYKAILKPMTQFLERTGRQKFLEPLYEGMMSNQEWNDFGNSIYNKSKKNYHPIAQQNIQSIIDKKESN